LKNCGNDSADIMISINRGCPAADIKRIKTKPFSRNQFHFSDQRLQKHRLQRQIGYRIKITIRAFPHTKRNVNVYSSILVVRQIHRCRSIGFLHQRRTKLQRAKRRAQSVKKSNHLALNQNAMPLCSMRHALCFVSRGERCLSGKYPFQEGKLPAS